MHTDTDAPPGADETEIPEATPLPEIEATPGPDTGAEDEDQEHETGGPPPLPPLLETGASTLATAGSGIYAATGAAGLVAAAGIATVAGVAYGFSRARAARAAVAGSRSGRGTTGGRGGRFFGSGSGGLTGRTARGAAGRGTGRAGGAGAGSRAGAGRGAAGARHRAGAGGLAGSSRAGAGRAGRAGGFGRGSSPAGRGGSRSPGSGGNLFGGSSAGRRGSGPSRGGSGGLFGGGGSSRGRSGGGRGGGGRGGGLFGPSAGSTARAGRRRSGRGRSTSIIDPASGRSRAGASRGRLRRGLRAGWTHPRVRRARAITRRGWSRGRIRVRDHTKRLSSYLRKRKWVLRARGWGRGLRDLFGRWWGALINRASDPRYGRLRGWELGVAAAAIGALGAGPKTAEPRVRILTGRVIGTAAPTPGDDGPIAMAGRMLLALTTGDEGEAPLAPEVQRVRDAADELRQALASLGGSQVGMLAYEQGLKELGPTLGAVAEGFTRMSETAEDEQPLDGSVLEFFRVISDAARGASEVAEEMPGLFRAAHEVELQRLENPRRGEHKWDISQQD